MLRLTRLAIGCAAGVAASVLVAAQTQSSQRPARDTPAQQAAPAPAPAGRISGRVVAADTGRPLSRTAVRLAAPEVPGGRVTLTDESGQFDFVGLPEGRYTLSASRAGYVGLSYGQRRPFQAGTPLQLANSQQLKGLDLRLPRGSVISGHVFDENGEPAPGTMVQVMQYRYAQGSRQLVPAGGAQTDDRGQYRVWGLNPGSYYVTAVARNAGGGRGGGPIGFGGRGAGPAPQDGSSDQVGYAPTYYPGVGAPQDATPVAVGLSAEAPGVDFKLLLVRTTRVEGRVVGTDGDAGRGNVVLVPEGQAGRGFGPAGGNYAGGIQRDGAFRIANVPPGRYVLRVRSLISQIARYASQPLVVGDGGVNDVTVILTPGASVAGTVSFQGTVPPDLSPFRVTASPAEPGFGQDSTARIEEDNRFLLVEIAPGPFYFRSQQSRGWSLKSVIMDGREVVDTPMELRSGQRVTGVTVVFTDRTSEINGTVTDQTQAPVTDYTILAFPTDSSLWRPQARQIMTARPDQNGTFQLRGLPAGEYYVAAVDPAEQGEWFEPAFLDEHRESAARLTLAEGDVRTQNFTVAVR